MAKDFKDWWRRNKDRINAARRAKYRADPRYREKKKEEFRDYYQGTRQAVTPVDRRTVVSGTGRMFVTIGRVARIINRRTNSIRRYHVQGVIPEPRYYDARGWRLYTPSQAELMRNVFSRMDDPNDNTITTLGDVRRALRAGWMEMTQVEEEVTSGSEETVTGRRSRNQARGRAG